MTTVERDKILKKCLEIESYMNQFDEHLENIRMELYTIDIKLVSVNNNVTKALLKYNKEIIFMHLSDNICRCKFRRIKDARKRYIGSSNYRSIKI